MEFCASATYQRSDQLSGGKDRICSPLKEIGITSNTGASRNRNRMKTTNFHRYGGLTGFHRDTLFDNPQDAGIDGKRRAEDDQHEHRQCGGERPVQGHDGLVVDFGRQQEDAPAAEQLRRDEG